ncbi:TPA: LOW QUALITY PROTEIN: hypothetical protein N0F65_004500 [Lagenidium giganteum]|uniref:Zinc finger PHD-type domain-containing protein n=1 Tax=Lagenidium giganteum TaxID=4803 RepID=A0AAV2YV56_9STRA|nr:TPA: LOW QUALITY PROTEIN: hypothetical protein N0F65_004500 [Lagenidium giganteum]
MVETSSIAIGVPQPANAAVSPAVGANETQASRESVAPIAGPPTTPLAMGSTPEGLNSTIQHKQSNADGPRGCIVCGGADALMECAGMCGLRVHKACIGEDLLFQSHYGNICGSCAVLQQNRASNENFHKGGVTGLSVRRAILWLNVQTNEKLNFDRFGHLASLRLHEIGAISGYPIKPFAEKFVEPYLQRWIREKLPAATSRTALNVRDAFTLMMGVYSLKQACVAHEYVDDLVSIIKRRVFSVTDFLGWHPSVEGPTVRCSSLCTTCGIRNSPELDKCSTCHHPLIFPTVFTKFASGILATFYAEQIRVPLGTTLLEVLAHTNTVRASYKGLHPYDTDGVDWITFNDQLRMIFSLLDVLSHFGVLTLNAEHFEPETKIIFNPVYINHAIQACEFEVVGKFLQFLRLFGSAKAAENFSLINVCEQVLLMNQLPDGSWCKKNGQITDQYKATVTCAKALLPPSIKGYGPVSTDFQRLLDKWARQAGAVKRGKGVDEKLLVCGGVVQGTTKARLKRLEAWYKKQGSSGSLDVLVTNRLREVVASTVDFPMTDVETSPEVSFKEEPFPAVDHEDEDTLTSLSLNGDLAIFDGLKFEDGDIIDISQQSASREIDDADDGKSDGESGEPTVQEEVANDDVYDDDDDEMEGEVIAEPSEMVVDPQVLDTGDAAVAEGTLESELAIDA